MVRVLLLQIIQLLWNLSCHETEFGIWSSKKLRMCYSNWRKNFYRFIQNDIEEQKERWKKSVDADRSEPTTGSSP